MQPKKLSEKASKIAKEVKALLEDINKFKPELEKKTIVAMRRYAAENVDQVFQKVMQEVNKENEDIINHPILYPNKVVCVYAAYAAQLKKYIISAAKLERKSFAYIVQDQRKKGVIHHTVEVFKHLIHQLTTFIQEGKYDNELHRSGEELIHKIMLLDFDEKIRDAEKHVDQRKDKKIPKYKATPKYERS